MRSVYPFLRTASCVLLLLFPCFNVLAAPPVFEPIGEERALNSNLFVREGKEFQFTVSAVDPDGDPLSYTAENLPSWGSFDSATGTFSGTPPLWPTDYEGRKAQPGVFDIYFHVTDGTYTVTKVVSIYVLESEWESTSVAELVDSRPITEGGAIGTPVVLRDVTEETVESSFGGGKTLRKITFGFTSQVPDVPGWEDDWVTDTNYVFLPVGSPAVQNRGAVVEGSYSGSFGELEFAEKACAELDIPVLIIDVDWPFTHAGEVMTKHNEKAIETGDPRYIFYIFSAAHYLRAADALITVIRDYTDWDASYDDFKVVFTGHSKLGHTCYKAAAARPDRVAGVMTSGSANMDSGAMRLLGAVQGAKSMNPEASPTYLGVMMRFFTENLDIEDQLPEGLKVLAVQGTDDSKDEDDGYCSKYAVLVTAGEADISYTLGTVPNVHHTTKTTQHSTYWRMWLAHCLLDRPLSQIERVCHHREETGITVDLSLSGTPVPEEVRVWATDQDDRSICAWDDFASYPMSLHGETYSVEIPLESTAYFVEVVDEADGVRGLITSAPTPVDKNYPLLPQPPGMVDPFMVDHDGSAVDLQWSNPGDEDFAGVIIRSSTEGFPSDPSGQAVYDGTGTSFSQDTPGESTYFAAFAYDEMGNYSDAALQRICVPGTGETPYFDRERSILHIPELIVGSERFSVDMEYLESSGGFTVMGVGPALCTDRRVLLELDDPWPSLPKMIERR